MTRKNLATLCFLLLFAVPALAAAGKGGVQLKSTAEVEIPVKNAQGVTSVQRVPASSTKVVPGDTVIFTDTYKNLGAKPAEGVVLTNPVPAYMTYVADSAEGQGAKIEFSIDHGKSYAAPDKLTIKDANGNEKTAKAADYTNIRWTLTNPIAPGTGGSVSFRAKVK